ncbi:MAG: ferrous iron transport protein B [Desulfobulbaceae bacterium]|nr:ferrous iron transport protein B [Desulfobulbaceae bacterium]
MPFNYLTGIYVDVSNYPGTTIEIARGGWHGHQIMDTPGIYGVSSFNDEERVARDIILDADLILNIVDGTHLERDLFLTQQLIDMGKPVVVALNFSDEMERSGLKIDVDLLHDLLGVEVIPTAAINGAGLDLVAAKLNEARPGRVFPDLQREVETRLSKVGSPAEALLVMEGDSFVAERHGLAPENLRDEIYRQRRNRVNDVIGHVLTSDNRRHSLRQIMGRLAVNPLTGVPILAVVLYAVYKVIGVWVAGDIVGITEEAIMQGHYEPWVRGLVGGLVNADSALGRILIGEFGLLTMTVTYLLGLLLPLVLGFYVILSIMEDSGYLPRLATLVDRLLTGLGLNGRAIIPLILGFGCVQLGTITTRLLGSRREKSIATVLLNFAVPCSAQLGVIAGMLAALGGKMTLLYASIIFIVLAVVGTLLNKTLAGKSTALLIDLPPMRLPRIENVARKTVTRSFFFMKEAYPWFFLGSFIVAVLQVTGGLAVWQRLLEPVTTGWLQIPKEAATAFVMGLVRRDFGAAGLTDLAMEPLQVVTSLVVITLFVPCIASLMILFKERGVKEAMLVWGGSWAVAFLVGGIFSQIMI